VGGELRVGEGRWKRGPDFRMVNGGLTSGPSARNLQNETLHLPNRPPMMPALLHAVLLHLTAGTDRALGPSGVASPGAPQCRQSLKPQSCPPPPSLL